MDSSTTISVSAGDKVEFLGVNVRYSSNTISSTAQFNVYGNAMSLILGKNYRNPEATPSSTSRLFYGLFSGCTTIISAKELVLPLLTLELGAYAFMFTGCTNLLSAPELPATEFTAGQNYMCMFDACTSLVEAPKTLPASVANDYAYNNMFRGCTSLQKSPDILCTSLTGMYCLYGMFSGCTNLNYIKMMSLTSLSPNVSGDWVRGVAATGTFVKNAEATWTTTGNNGIPAGWTVETATE